MSELEKKSVREGASGVMVTDSAGSWHKQPYRPTELQDDSRELHHKRSKAPAVPSVAEELKTLSEDNPNENVDVAERKDNERAPSADKFKHHISKKLSSSKKKGSSADVPIPAVELETKMKDSTPSPSQPIPPGVASVSGISVIGKVPEPSAEKKEEDIIDTEETEDLRTAAEPKHSEWDTTSTKDKDAFTHGEGDTRLAVFTKKSVISTACNSTNLVSKKEVSWDDDQQYLPKLHFNEMGDECHDDVCLERKSSLGPCKSRTLYEGPSGISLYVPRKSSSRANNVHPRRSGINLTISKKCMPGESKFDMVAKKSTQETRAVKVDPHIPYVTILSKLRGKYIDARDQYVNVRDKFKNVLHI